METRYLFCFGCGNIFSLVNRSDIICPECSFEKNHRKYQKILRYAHNALKFGYRYRKTYEEDYARRGNLDTRYALTPTPEIFAFLAIAALSGIVGGERHAKDVYIKSSTEVRQYVETMPGDKVVIDLSEEEMAAFIKFAAPTHAEYVAKLEAKGLPGQAVYDEMLRAIEKYK